jgi:hypothetical protein
MAPANNSCFPAFLYKNGTKVIPLTYSVFLSKLKRFLSVLGINNNTHHLCERLQLLCLNGELDQTQFVMEQKDFTCE